MGLNGKFKNRVTDRRIGALKILIKAISLANTKTGNQ